MAMRLVDTESVLLVRATASLATAATATATGWLSLSGEHVLAGTLVAVVVSASGSVFLAQRLFIRSLMRRITALEERVDSLTDQLIEAGHKPA